MRADLGSGNFAAYVAGDPRVDTISAMGLTLAPSVRQLRASTGHFAHYLGFEHADRLADVDILVSWFYHNDAERDGTAAMPLYAAIPAVKRGSYVALSDPSLVMASSSGAPLAWTGCWTGSRRNWPPPHCAPARQARESMMHRHAKVTFAMHRADSRQAGISPKAAP